MFIASNWTEVRVLFTSLELSQLLAIIVIVSAGASCTNVICPNNGTYDLCIFEIFVQKQIFWT